MAQYGLLLFAIFVEIVATTCLKLTESFTLVLPTIGVLFGYGLSFYLVSIVVKTIPVGVAYAIWSGLGIVGTSVASYFLYSQALSMGAIAGITLIIIGVIVMQFANPASH